MRILYPTIYQKAARLCYGLAKNHAFIDGNKRIAAICMQNFLLENGIELEFSQKELVDLFLNISNNKIKLDDIVIWILNHMKN